MSVPVKRGTADGPSALRAVLVVLVAGTMIAGAGCSGLGGGPGSGGGPALDTVPANADVVGYVDVQGALNDQNLRDVANKIYSLQEDGPENVDEAIADLENESDLEISGLQSVTFYAGSNVTGAVGDSYAAAIISTDWSEEELVASIENESDLTLEESTYAGSTLYSPSDAEEFGDSYLGVLGDGQYVVGNEQAVKDALDVAAGNADAVSGEVRTAFENTRSDAYVRFAVAVPQDEFDTGDIGGGMNTDVFNEVTVVSGSHYTEGEDIALSVTMTFSDESAASDASDVLDGARSTYRGLVSDNQTKQLLSDENLVIEQDGTDVTVTSRNSVETINAVIQTFYESSFGGGAAVAVGAPALTA